MRKTKLYLGILLLATVIGFGCNPTKSIDDEPNYNIRTLYAFELLIQYNYMNVFTNTTAKTNSTVSTGNWIDEKEKIIHLKVHPKLNYAKLRPRIWTGPRSTVSPASLEWNDFSADTTWYKVTAQSGLTAEYGVVFDKSLVYESAALASVNLVDPIILNPETELPFRTTLWSSATVDSQIKEITLTLPYGTDSVVLKSMKLSFDYETNSVWGLWDKNMGKTFKVPGTTALDAGVTYTSEVFDENTFYDFYGKRHLFIYTSEDGKKWRGMVIRAQVSVTPPIITVQ